MNWIDSFYIEIQSFGVGSIFVEFYDFRYWKHKTRKKIRWFWSSTLVLIWMLNKTYCWIHLKTMWIRLSFFRFSWFSNIFRLQNGIRFRRFKTKRKKTLGILFLYLFNISLDLLIIINSYVIILSAHYKLEKIV